MDRTTTTSYPDSRRDLRADKTRRERIRDRLAADPTLTATAKIVANELLRYSDRSAKPTCPSNSAVATTLGLCTRTVQLATLELEQAGVIKKCLRPIARRRNATNAYYWCSPPPISALPEHREGQRRRLRCGASRWKACSDRVNLSTGEPNSSLTSTPGPAGFPARRPGQRSNHLPKQRLAPTVVPPSDTWSDQKGCHDCDYTGWIEDLYGTAERCSCTTA